MTETDRTDMTEQRRDALDRDPKGPEVPSPSNPQIPAGVVPPGGPAPSTGDVLAERQAEQRRLVDEAAPPAATVPTAEELEHARDMPADEAKGTPG